MMLKAQSGAGVTVMNGAPRGASQASRLRPASEASRAMRATDAPRAAAKASAVPASTKSSFAPASSSMAARLSLLPPGASGATATPARKAPRKTAA